MPKRTLIIGLLLVSSLFHASQGQSNYVYFIELQNELDANPYTLYQSQYDGRVFFLSEDEILPLLLSSMGMPFPEAAQLDEDNLLLEEDFLPSSCFIPTGKLITENYTYIFSTYSFTAIVFKNSAPYTPSSEVVATDFLYSEELVEWLLQLQNTYYTPEHFAQIQILAGEVAYCDATLETKIATLEEDYEVNEVEYVFVYKPLIENEFNYTKLILEGPIEEEIQKFAILDPSSILLEE
jgi:hypothetical protein